MTLVDANILVYAFRGEYHHHSTARAWLASELQQPPSIFVHPLAAAAFLRVVTRTIGALPASPVCNALDFLSTLQPIAPANLPDDAAHLEVVRRLAERHQIAGDGCNDLWLAAFAIRHRLILASADRGFARFQPELQWLNPLTA